jgi:8-oxo-dGTP pyrophosphatase MutT (NUDIX family)
MTITTDTSLADASPIAFSADHFNGVIIDADRLPDDGRFAESLGDALDVWTGAGKRLVWLKVPLERSGLVPIAAAHGFTYHHANDHDVTMTRRLVPEAFVPTHATHYVGVGGVVINDRRELLVVCERHRATNRKYYKLPGGALQPGEHLVDAVLREVQEETGIECRFEALVCFRHWHGYRYGKSDIYFVCRLSPLNQEVTVQVEEIEECLWMPIDEYLSSELVSPFNKRIVRAAERSQGVSPEWIEGHTDPARYEFFMPDETHSDEPLGPTHVT